MSRAALGGAGRAALEGLARARNVATSYLDVAGNRQVASDETLVRILAALGEPVGSPADATGVLADRRRRRGPAQPAVVVAWDGRLPALPRAGPDGGPGAPLAIREEGATADRRLEAHADGEGRVVVDEPVGLGVHELVGGGGEHRCWVVAAPGRAPAIAPDGGDRLFGVFAPAYALVDRRRRPAGDLTSLGRLGEVAAGAGAGVVATLPLLAELSVADGAGHGQQPYAPLSRLWWNEGYLDLERLPELADPEARRLVAGAVAACAAPGRRAPDGRLLADVSAAAAAARPALDHAAGVLSASSGERRRAFEAFAASRPDLDRYAGFRAAVEVAGPDPRRWPAAWRRGELAPGELPKEALARHRYAQFATEAQLAELAAGLGRRGCGLLLDLPVGCNAAGYDPFAYPEAFAAGASVGAPPDDFFREGQDWGFPPPRPETDRRAGYPFLRAVLARNAAHAWVLRVDHVLGWSRLWWVPEGLAPTEGAYVRYPTDELLAVACLEASRAGCALVGEDLGTVPAGLRPALRRRGIAGMRVAVFDLAARPGRPLRPPAGTVACLDTHDTATFAGFAAGADVDLRERLGLVPAAEAGAERAGRRALVDQLERRLRRAGLLGADEAGEPRAVLGALLEELGRSPAELVVVALDDLLGEVEPQNVPGTTTQHDNFSRTLAPGLEELAADGDVRSLLERLAAARRRAGTSVPARGVG